MAGFAPSLLDGSARLGPVSPLVLLHALIATPLRLLFVLQGTLVATGRAGLIGPSEAWHNLMGWLMGWLVG